MNLIERNKQRIAELCQQHSVLSLYVFGSVLTDRFNSESDIDFVVSFAEVDAANYVENYLSMQDSLAQILGRDIDLIEDKAIRNPILRQNIDRTKQPVYGRV